MDLLLHKDELCFDNDNPNEIAAYTHEVVIVFLLCVPHSFPCLLLLYQLGQCNSTHQQTTRSLSVTILSLEYNQFNLCTHFF